MRGARSEELSKQIKYKQYPLLSGLHQVHWMSHNQYQRGCVKGRQGPELWKEYIMFVVHGYLLQPIKVSLNAIYFSIFPFVALDLVIQQKGAAWKQQTMELERFTGRSVFSRHAFVSGLMVARAKNPVHSILKMIRRTNDIIVDVWGILFSID